MDLLVILWDNFIVQMSRGGGTFKSRSSSIKNSSAGVEDAKPSVTVRTVVEGIIWIDIPPTDCEELNFLAAI